MSTIKQTTVPVYSCISQELPFYGIQFNLLCPGLK